MRNVVGHARRRERAWTRRVHGDVDDVELHLFYERAGVHVRRLRLARKADDHVRREPDVGHELARVVDDRPIVPSLIAARHALQHSVVAGLHGQLQLATHDFAAGHHLQELELEVLRVRREETQALQARNLLRLTHQRGEAATPRRVVVVVDVLAE